VNSNRPTHKRSRALLLLVAGMSLSQAFADSPWYPRVLLNKGDHAVLIPPEAMFNRELGRMKFPPAQTAAKPAPDSYEIQTAEAELSDLAVALRRDGTAEPACKLILDDHAEARARLRRGEAGDVTDGLPKEFASYLRGSIALRKGDTASALYEWESILNFPPAERHFKSTWTAFMLAKLLTETEPQQSIEYFQRVRTFASSGFADSAGLAAASIGWEARVHRIQRDFRRSLELYIDQHASGDESAMNSLRFVASDALYEAKNHSLLVTNPLVRRVVTAFAISSSRIYWPDSGEPHEAIAKWLAAVGSVEVTDPDEAEMLALAAYRGAAFDAAQRWLKRAPTRAVTLWLQAKLQLRAGKVNQALSLLGRAHGLLPDRPENEESPHDTLADNVFISDRNIDPRQHILGEMGVLRMTRREYTEALDCFLHGGFWADAAYVAERVLTTEELKAYIDREWDESAGTLEDKSKSMRPYIRHLLARRLVRSFLPAGEYFPNDLQPTYHELMASLKRGENESLPPADRAGGWFAGAKVLKEHGLELIGTELEPDWHLTGGSFERGLTVASRTNDCSKVLMPSADELSRARRHHADPEERFHYRYQAAFIALQAASLLPDNSDQKAQILHTAGTWLKDRDPQTADIFYKHLVRRCRETELGSVADVKRWFPALDGDGNIVGRRPTPEPGTELLE
jgi:tetratricopeptide (TPR) repeat protein